jgi:hypothetical protein
VKIVSRKQAVEAGLKRYFTGKPCPYGHISERQVSNNSCNECLRIAAGKYKKRKPEVARRHCKTYYDSLSAEEKIQILARQRRNYAKNPLPNKRSIRKWYDKNRSKVAAMSSQQYQRNKGVWAERSRQWYRDHPEVMNAKNARRRSAKLNATPPWLSKELEQKIAGFYREARSRTQATGIEHHVDHIVPLKSDVVCGLHVPWNLQILTGSENSRKCNKLTI